LDVRDRKEHRVNVDHLAEMVQKERKVHVAPRDVTGNQAEMVFQERQVLNSFNFLLIFKYFNCTPNCN
uniref:ERGIC_N domain-containing protein n=1 Tax=Gongylonema pulchrum TaxID=637853 RepID=A0A183EUB9_9BILA